MLKCASETLLTKGWLDFLRNSITPIYKKESDELLENYRPVSTLPIFGKIFEKIIYSRLYKYFVSKGILHDGQFGFRKQHSKSHALNYSIDKIKQSIEKGVRGNTLSLIESYLSNRKQCVSALGEISEELAVIFGVPKGSCLGPLLFLIYINDISNICKSNELILFADDTNIFVKGKSKQEVYIEANMILKQLSIYTMLNKLHVNLVKSCFMYFTKTSRNDENDNENDNIPPIMIWATEIKRVSEIKFLGVVIDEKLSWVAHVKSLTKKLASCTGSINRIAASIPKTLYMNLYYTLFESYITYGITVWGSIPTENLINISMHKRRF